MIVSGCECLPYSAVSPLHYCYGNKKPPDPTIELPKGATVVKAGRDWAGCCSLDWF